MKVVEGTFTKDAKKTGKDLFDDAMKTYEAGDFDSVVVVMADINNSGSIVYMYDNSKAVANVLLDVAKADLLFGGEG